MDLLFDFAARPGQRASIIGTMTQPLTFTATGPVDLLGVRFRPGYLPELLGLNAAELTDKRVDLTDYWGKMTQDIWHRLFEMESGDRVRLLRHVLWNRVKGQIQTDPFIRHCIARIESTCGGLRIGELEMSTGLSARQLERKFARHLGISPKLFARIVRFKKVVAAAVRADPPDWARLASDFGFADQPHLVREFKAFSGLTPASGVLI